jgi:molybdopterin/thiamine biosynthesis adenylyltransferase
VNTGGVTPSTEGSGYEDLERFAFKLDADAAVMESRWRPWMIRLVPGEFPALEALCRDRGIRIVDSIDRQLADLALVRWPAAEAAAAGKRFVEDLVAEHGGTAYYGTWVFFPWDSRIVHVLEREDYFAVITNRNQDKITGEEQRLLRTKRVGVVGLSVGAEIAVVLAQEHLCGSIVLADFDCLDLSNLNRLNAGVDELGENKAHLAARRIAKIDPYLEVVVYDEGISVSNAIRFLDGLHLLIEECDSLEMKYHLRSLARERRLNLVYAADERGLLSVEPFAHAPDMCPFHGRSGGPPPSRESFPSPRAFMRALTEWLGGWDQISERSRRSVECIGDTLCGYPQLATEPRLAAGQVGHVARRLLLGERLAPFFGHLDLGEQLSCH